MQVHQPSYQAEQNLRGFIIFQQPDTLHHIKSTETFAHSRYQSYCAESTVVYFLSSSRQAENKNKSLQSRPD